MLPRSELHPRRSRISRGSAWLTSPPMDHNQPEESRSTGWPSALMLLGVFVAAIAITLAIGSRSETSTSAPFPDLGDITAADPNVPNTEDVAPGFTLATLDGQQFDLGSHVSNDARPIVRNLWASWCAPCRAEMPAIDIAASRHPEVAFVGVAVQDNVEDATAFATEIGISYTIAFDDETVEEAYPVLGLPATFFISADGAIAKRHFGIVTIDSLDDDIAALFGS